MVKKETTPPQTRIQSPFWGLDFGTKKEQSVAGLSRSLRVGLVINEKHAWCLSWTRDYAVVTSASLLLATLLETEYLAFPLMTRKEYALVKNILVFLVPDDSHTYFFLVLQLISLQRLLVVVLISEFGEVRVGSYQLLRGGITYLAFLCSAPSLATS